MATPDRAVELRRGNVTARLPRGSKLLLFDAWDVVRPLGERGAAVLCAPIADEAAIAGVLRAAREAGSVVGLAAPFVPGDREAPGRIFAAVCAAAEATGCRGPIFLQAGPIRLGPADAAAPERVADWVFRYLDAGFTLVSLDASRLSPEGAARVCAVAARPAAEAEVSIEVAPPHPHGSQARDFVRELVEAGISPRFLRVEAGGLAGGALEPLAEAVSRTGGVVSAEDQGGLPYRSGRELAKAGLRKFDAAADFGRAAMAGLIPAMRDALIERAEAARLPVTDLVALRGGEPEGSEAAERIEALSYLQAQGWLEALGTAGSAEAAAAADFD